MDASDVQRWVGAYRRAWESNEPADIAGLFTEGARYFTAPFRRPWEGREAIVAGWLDRRDEPGDSEFRFEVLALCDGLAFVRAWTRYRAPEPHEYANLWIVRLEPGGRCSEFVEWWMPVPGPGDDPGA